MTGALMMWLAVQPWAGSMAAIREVERSGSRFYKVDTRTNMLYYQVERASSGIRQNHTQHALEAAEAGKQLDPTNPLFDYLESAALWHAGDKRRAVKAAAAGAKKDTLRVYGSLSVEPVAWQWPEIEQIALTAREIAADKPDDVRQVLSALLMADKVVWSEPAHPVRIMLGLSARYSIVSRLASLLSKSGDKSIEEDCQKMMVEGRVFRAAWSRWLASQESSTGNERALAVQRALRESSHHHNAVAIIELDEQAQWAEACRGKYVQEDLAQRVAFEILKRKRSNAGK